MKLTVKKRERESSNLGQQRRSEIIRLFKEGKVSSYDEAHKLAIEKYPVLSPLSEKERNVCPSCEQFSELLRKKTKELKGWDSFPSILSDFFVPDIKKSIEKVKSMQAEHVSKEHSSPVKEKKSKSVFEMAEKETESDEDQDSESDTEA